MTASLVEEAKSYLTHDVVGQISRQLGESEQNTQTALNGAIPALLSGLIQKASQPGGSSSVMDLVAGVTTPDRSADEVIEPVGGIPGQLSQLLDSTGGQMDHLLATGSSITASLFGDKTGAVAGALAMHSGVKQSSASSLLNLSGPVLLSVLRQKMFDDDTSVAGLPELLGSQTSHVQASMPPGLSSVLGTQPTQPTAGGPTANMSSNGLGTSASVRQPIAPPVSNFAYGDDEMNDITSGSGNHWLPWLMLALGALALFFILRSCTNDGTETQNKSTTTLADSANVASDANTKLGTAIDNASTATSPAGATADSANSQQKNN